MREDYHVFVRNLEKYDWTIKDFYNEFVYFGPIDDLCMFKVGDKVNGQIKF